ncbi:CHO2 [[Candida] subhashii]|uniref:Phosphatidylethanolamine N-methyltransferase n=1 Tax=[Candida] subhashii TaxID=561895 RepID=A0A8J5QFA1_9ASCO|nr:CHO2 [[Candida] subhashii]KAG7663441.1 CHO2 [[Candida] subhashii]
MISTQVNTMSSKKDIPTQSKANGPKGITFSGETFIVPETHDMVKTLFDPTIRKSNFEIIILTCLFSNLLVFLIPNNQFRIKIFISFYILWRLSYNFGIGWLLRNQSNSNRLVGWAKDLNLFDKSNDQFLAKFVQSEVQSQRGKDYKINSLPVEFNTWLIFRKFVDLILMSDFVTFVCVVITCAIDDNFQFIHNQPNWVIYSRIIGGFGLILFNLWVKVNAHNTIKDYAWYWGDFFFRQINNEELIFDGVFEMVPHPMYSVGYIGYYGFALIAKSYTVLAIAIFGHFLQMVFLYYIENPHIDKIYGPSKNEINLIKILKLKDLKNFDNLKPLVGLYNFNWLRASDVVNLILVGTYGVIIPVLSKSVTNLFVLTIAMKLFESFSINILLVLQSHSKHFTKWCLANDIPVEKSLNNWAIMYNSLINVTYSSLFGLNLVYYLDPVQHKLLFNDWFYLRILLGITLMLTQTWINASIIDSIGYFGWFYGDFFIPKSQSISPRLTKAGVYRYLNNPEQIFGVCGVMGLFILSPTVENMVCCIIWVANNFIRINFIEKVHMIKVYGESEVLKDSGVVKTFKKHLIPESLQRRLSNDTTNGEADGISRKRSKSGTSLADSLDNFIRDLKNSTTKLSQQKLIELSQNLTFANSDYKLTIKGLQTDKSKAYLPKYTYVGAPITVTWHAPRAVHSTGDWIGLYKVVHTSYSRNKTLISSSGRWTHCNEPKGSFTFDKKRLFWEDGVYEFRYHLAGKHDVTYVSEPFEIKWPKIQAPLDKSEVDSFSQTLKEEIFDKLLEVEDVNTPLIHSLKDDDIVKTYNLLSDLISNICEVKISSKAFLNHDDLTIRDVAYKIINIKQVLEELSHNNNDDMIEKKDI